MKTIVIAWAEMTGLRDTGKLERFDGYNYRPIFEPCLEARACVWLNQGCESDIERAQTYADGDLGDASIYRVYAYPLTEQNPLKRARQEILHEAESEKKAA